MLEQTAFWEQHHFKVLTLSSKNPDKTQVSRLRKKIQDIVNLLYSCFPAGTMVVLSFSKTLFKVKKKKSNQTKNTCKHPQVYISNTPAVVDTVGQKTREEEVKDLDNE